MIGSLQRHWGQTPIFVNILRVNPILLIMKEVNEKKFKEKKMHFSISCDNKISFDVDEVAQMKVFSLPMNMSRP